MNCTSTAQIARKLHSHTIYHIKQRSRPESVQDCFQAGKVGGALRFSGIDSHATIPDRKTIGNPNRTYWQEVGNSMIILHRVTSGADVLINCNDSIV